MKSYPSIDGPSRGQKSPCHVFVKYDGSNLRFEWSRKRGWYKFGTRKTLFDDTHPIFGTAVALFLEKYGDALPKIFQKEKMFQGVKNFVVFTEWFGAKSFSGAHKPWDKRRNIVLFDVNPMKKGILGPKDFLDLFGHLPVAEVVYQGNFGPWLVDAVRKEEGLDLESKYDVRAEIPEGVVCKGGRGHELWMCKVKTERYKAALKELYEADWEKYWEGA
jgi:hypothetical protein